MKLKKIASICAKSKIVHIFDKADESGESVSQWIGDSYAMYPLNGLPYLEQENICTLFDISEKQSENYLFRHSPAPAGVNLDDTDPAERLLDDGDVSIIYGGSVLKPLITRRGITFIQSKYLAPLEDVLEVVQLFERVTPDGLSYIVAKTGLLMAAVIFPYSVINEKFVARLEELSAECRRALALKEAAERRQNDSTQATLFNVDESTGEIVGERKER